MSEIITSTTNPVVKETASLSQKKYRDEANLFLAEGEKAILGLDLAGYEIEKLFIKEQDCSTLKNVRAKKVYYVKEAVLSKISTTKSPCNAVAVVKQREYSTEDLKKAKRLLLLENIKDAGNLGTILRSCKAFGVNGILLLEDTIDFYNPKVVRASVGCFDLPVLKLGYVDLMQFKDFNVYSTALYEKGKPLREIKFEEPMILAFGSEAEGLSKEFLNSDIQKRAVNFKIETSGEVESLNLATAVSVCLYKIFVK